MLATSLTPLFSKAVIKLHAEKPIKSATILAQVIYADGTMDTLELTEQAIAEVAVKKTAAKKKEPLKLVNTEPVVEVPKMEMPKVEIPPEPKLVQSGKVSRPKVNEPKGTPPLKDVEKKGFWRDERYWLGRAVYRCKNGLRDVAILGETKDRKKWAVACIVTTRYGESVPPDALVWFPYKDSPKLSNVRFKVAVAA